MKQGDLVTIDIIDAGMEGEGIGRADGMAVFVPKTVVGDRVRVELTAVKKNLARGRVVAIEKQSEDRVEPFCSYAGECGGCQLQSMSYEAQLRLKEKWVRDRLKRIGGVEDGKKVRPTLGMESPKYYRNKAQFPINAGTMRKNNEGRYRNTQPCRIGFYRPRSHQVVDCEQCAIQAPAANAIMGAVRRYVAETGVSIYDEKSGMGQLRHVVVKSGFVTGEVMAVFVVNGNRLPRVERLVELCDEAVNALGTEEEWFWSLESVVLNVNQSRGSEIMGRDCVTIAGKPTILDCIGDLTFEISPLSFYQVNPVQTLRLYEKVKEYAALTGKETVLDLYCGVGTIGLFCADQAARVIGVEAVKQAVIDANRNAVLNGIVNAEYICGRAEEILPKRLSGIKAEVVILDPPRSGCMPELIDAVLSVSPQRIVYVSCDPATLARDIRLLTAGGYQLEEAQPVDMFSHTVRIETVVMLSHKKPDNTISVKVEFGEGEGKVPLDNIAKRAESHKPKERVTYKMIKEYILERHGVKVSSLYIAQVKQKHGIIERDCYNHPKNADARQPQCPPEKEKLIEEALRYFQMIS